ncbi:unnamed protein product [Sphagnum troendelagicum]|uniref:Uncharacterized protein n=1 Tax=Sphagnum troendelagicum TaxID=128251 RepID=A0ABP0UHT6_9BRYO
MTTGRSILLMVVLLLSSWLLATSANVYIISHCGGAVKVSVKKNPGIPKQMAMLGGNVQHNFTVGAGKIGTFTFVHTSFLAGDNFTYVHKGIARVNLTDGQEVILMDQFMGPGIVGLDFSQLDTGRPVFGNQIFGPI